MEEDTNEQVARAHLLYSPPSHQASDGEVWRGETAPSPSLLAEALAAPTVAGSQSKKPGDR
jgi:hypothetical protein